MKSAIALLSVLALAVSAEDALNIEHAAAWERAAAKLQRMNFDHDHEPNRRMGPRNDWSYNYHGNEQSIHGYGLRDRNIQREMDYPALPVIQQENIIQSIFVDALTSGAVQVVYRSPDGGRVLVSLYNSANDILLRISMRFDSSSLVLNSRTAKGSWETEVRPPGFPTYFPCCGSVITVRIEILETAFVVSANGIEISTFEFRIPPPIAEVEYTFVDRGTPEKAELLSMSVHT